jgi:hypothetical protein
MAMHGPAAPNARDHLLGISPGGARACQKLDLGMDAQSINGRPESPAAPRSVAAATTDHSRSDIRSGAGGGLMLVKGRAGRAPPVVDLPAQPLFHCVQSTAIGD